MGPTPPGQTKERVFRFVQQRIVSGMPPTVREVQRAMGFSAVQTAMQHLETLVAEGRLVKTPGKARGYSLPGFGLTVLVPLLGRVQAGDFTTAIQQHEGTLPVQVRSEDREYFALRVRGESMKGAGILPGDIVVVQRQATANSGDIVVALVEDEATIKRLRLRHGKVELHPENSQFTVLKPDPQAVTILGKVIEVRRFLDTTPSWLEDLSAD